MQDSTTEISPLLLDHIYTGDALDTLHTLPDGVVNCVVTSPPYYGLRDYGVAGQIGLEQTMSEYIGNLVELFREVRRVLRADGTAWINLGDSYVNAGSDNTKVGGFTGQRVREGKKGIMQSWDKRNNGLPEKSLMMIPARVAIALQDDGWILRSEIVWHKPNPMPESVTDRPTKAHEMIYLLSQSPQYFYDADAIKEPASPVSVARVNQKTFATQTGGEKDYGKTGINPSRSMRKALENWADHPEYRNARSVWTIPTQPTKEAHFATFPQELVRRCILAGCPLDGVVLDPFMGSGTTALVARQLNRRYVGIELNPAYVEMAERRLAMPFQTDMLYHTPQAVRND